MNARIYTLADARASASLGWLIGAMIAASLAGCSSRDHGKPDVPRAAVAIALAWTEAGMPSADTTPAPSPDGGDATQCWNCKGRGKVGDGVTMMTCQVCGGSGRSTPMSYQEAPHRAALPEVEAVAEIINDAPPPPDLAAPVWFSSVGEAIKEAATIEGGFVVAICSPDWAGCGPCVSLMTALDRLPPLTDGVLLKMKISRADAMKLQGKQRLEECSFPFVVVLAPVGEADANGLIEPVQLAKGPASADPKSLSPILKRARARALQLSKEQSK